MAVSEIARPVLQISKTNVNDLLKEGGRGNAGSRRARWMSGTIVVVELALTLVLLVVQLGIGLTLGLADAYFLSRVLTEVLADISPPIR